MRVALSCDQEQTMRLPHLASFGLAILLAGCGPEVVGPKSNELARLRLASASPDAGALALVVHEMTVARVEASTAASTPAYLEPSQRPGEGRASGTATAVAVVPLDLEAGKSYTDLV